MPNTFFRFQRFVVHQERCAMKVGTDGVLIGAWAKGGKRVLDIGTGTGLVALMMAQRYRQARVDAVDIDPECCLQAEENVADSPFPDRVEVFCSPVQTFANDDARKGLYDAVVSNPPFFDNALKAPDSSRRMARHTDSLPFAELFQAVSVVMAPLGEFSAIIPFDYKLMFEREAAAAGLFLTRSCAVKTTPTKNPKRYLLAFRKQHSDFVEVAEEVLEVSPGCRSAWYRQLTSDFYL